MVAESAILNGLMPPSEHNSSICASTYDVVFRSEHLQIGASACLLAPADSFAGGRDSSRLVPHSATDELERLFSRLLTRRARVRELILDFKNAGAQSLSQLA